MTNRYLIFLGGLLICGVFLRSVVMPMRGSNTQEIIIERGGVVAPAPVNLPCDQEATIL